MHKPCQADQLSTDKGQPPTVLKDASQHKPPLLVVTVQKLVHLSSLSGPCALGTLPQAILGFKAKSDLGLAIIRKIY